MESDLHFVALFFLPFGYTVIMSKVHVLTNKKNRVKFTVVKLSFYIYYKQTTA